MLLTELLTALKVWRFVPSTSRTALSPEEIDIRGFAMDSRLVKADDLFVCIVEPDLADRSQFIPMARSAGASCALIDESIYKANIPGIDELPAIVVPNVQIASAVLASHFYNYPMKELSLMGVTGTKGKTSTAFFTAHLLKRFGISAGVIGTTGAHVGEELLESTNTSPHSINLHRLLRQMRVRSCQAVCMEVSSHALKLHRIAGCTFKSAVFTNIGHDHMDFHATHEDYVRTKSLLMAKVVDGLVVINTDDVSAVDMVEVAACEVLTYGLDRPASLRASNVKYAQEGTQFDLATHFGTFQVSTRLPGLFNVYNTLAAIGAAFGMGVPLKDAALLASELRGVPGRLEPIETAELGISVFVDYAHTPESLDNVLSSLKSMNPRRLISVFGCGGDRDRTKRPVMGRISTKHADFTIITSDNPRREDPDAILEDIREGIKESVSPAQYDVERDRRTAISRAIEMAEPGDVVAICGKGHETGQIVGEVKFPFDDREVAREVIEMIVNRTQR